MKKRLVALILFASLTLTFFTGCKKNNGPVTGGGLDRNDSIGNDNASFGDSLEDLGAFDGYFEEELNDVTVTWIAGTKGAYKMEGNTLTFTALTTNSIYAISGKLAGNIVIDVGEAYDLELELTGFSLVSDSASPITVKSGDKISIQAKRDTENFIYDIRPAVDEDDDTAYSGAIHSEVDLEISGKGKLSVVSSNNNGIHSKDDLQVKNLNLTVSCKDNALKGNDTVSLENATAILIATVGDGIKTSNSNISEKGNQRGDITFNGGSYDIFAACDGLDAAHNVAINGDETKINIYTDKYSNYSEDVVTVSGDYYYIRFNYSDFKYSVKYYNSDSDYIWVNPEHHSTVSGSRSDYYYYSFSKNSDYAKIQFFVYTSDMEQGQSESYAAASDLITPSQTYDTLALTVRNGYLYYDWTNYTTTVNDGFGGPGGPGGPGGMDGGNTDKGDHSTKGIKAANEIVVNGGTINVKSYDDGLHANNDVLLENGNTPTGNITINGGDLTVFSNDDGLHADGGLTVNGGNINVVNSYEGIEGTTVSIIGGNVSIIAKDDGLNATAESGTAVTISGGSLYIYCGGDGIDSNSRTSYSGIHFNGGRTLIITTSGGNSAIDTEMGYTYSAGSVVAIMPRGGMSNEATHCQSFSSVGRSVNLSINKGDYLVCDIGKDTLTVNMSVSLSALVITLGDRGASVNLKSSASENLSEGEFIWK